MTAIIGITCGYKDDRYSHIISDYYARAVYAAGGLPAVMPSLDPDLADRYYRKFDGFLFSGGPDLDPVYFGEEPRYGLGEISPLRDAFELTLAEKILQGEKPVLAICRGIQVINVAAGGTLYQDLQGITSQLHFQKAPRWYPTHEVHLKRESKLYQVIKKEYFRVNSFHHQAVKDCGKALNPVCFSRDGVIEGLEGADPGLNLLAVQWHPECSWERDEASFALFSELVKRAGG